MALDTVSLSVGAGGISRRHRAEWVWQEHLAHDVGRPRDADIRNHHLQRPPITGPAADRSLIFQQPSLYPWLSALDNVAFGLMLQGIPRKERRQRAEEFLRQVGLLEFAKKHPHELSGGMQQRAAIARALCLGADVLLMDEPFAALDVQTRFQMQSFLLDIWQGREKRSSLSPTTSMRRSIWLIG